MPVEIELETEGHPGGHPQVAQAQLRVDEVGCSWTQDIPPSASEWQMLGNVPVMMTRSKQDKVPLILVACRSMKVFMLRIMTQRSAVHQQYFVHNPVWFRLRRVRFSKISFEGKR